MSPGIRVRVTQMVDGYERKKRKCFRCQSEDHLLRDCPRKGELGRYLNDKGTLGPQGTRKPPTKPTAKWEGNSD